MRIRDLSIHASSWAKLPTNLEKRDFNISCWHVQEIFLHYLPRGYVLDGMGKTNIECGPANGQKTYMQLIDVNQYYVEDFDFKEYSNSAKEKQQNIILNTIKESLLCIAKQHNVKTEPIEFAYQKVIESKFGLTIETKLGRSTKSRRLRLKVIREIKYGAEDWYINLCAKDGKVLEKVFIAQQLMITEGLHQYRKSLWQGSNFIIVDHVASETFRLDVQPLEEKYGSI